ncbi:hypothetical protein [Massilia sp. Bi118]|uniref:hypothetical protein n=1 Tax=Massilia sp. Bi118 TaxID=2822346 RepID=UPI001E296507|nr:hypothetical protein [Massilia sp. Bi118]
MILLEVLRQGTKIDCRQCHREQCATGQTLLANLIFSVHDLSLFVVIRFETFVPVVQDALINLFMQIQFLHLSGSLRPKGAFPCGKLKSLTKLNVLKKVIGFTKLSILKPWRHTPVQRQGE